MRRARVAVLLVLSLALVAALAACNTAAPTGTGQLSVTVSGLPSGVNGDVVVTMGGYSHTVTSTTTLSSLAPGTYTVAPQTVTLRRNAFLGTAGSATVTVANGATSSDSVAYAVQRGDLWAVDFGAGSVDMFTASTLESSPTPAATITSGLNSPSTAAFDAAGNLWVVSYGNGKILEYLAGSLTSNPSPAATISTGLSQPWGAAFDASGNLWVANFGTSTVVEYAAANLTSNPSPAATISGVTGAGAIGLAFDSSGNLWVANVNNSTVVEYLAANLTSNPSAAHTISTGLNGPHELTFDANGNLWVGNSNNSTDVRYAAASLTANPSPAATVTTSTGSPEGVSLDVNGDLWVAHQSSVIEEFAAADVAGTGSLTPADKATIGGVTSVEQTVFDPPPYNLPLSH